MNHYELSSLDNGLRIASERMEGAQSTAFAIAVDVGARHEEPDEGGLSHLLEHMAFKGTQRLNARRIAEVFDLMGGNVNAYTSHEHTVYYAKVLKEYADDALKLLCEIIADSIFDEAELERERQVILQEIAMHCDSPDDLVFDLFQEAVFKGQPLGRSILGSAERVGSFTRDDLLRYTEKHYQPVRMVVAAAGAVDHDHAHRIVEGFFAKQVNAPERFVAAGAHYVGGEKILEKDLEQIQLVLGFPGVAVTDVDYYPMQMFATILGGGMSSRLFQEIRELRGLAYSVSSFASGYQDVGVLGIYAGTTQEHLSELLIALKEVLAGAQEGVSAAELLRAKNQLKAGMVMTRENPGSVAEWIARHLHVHGRYRTADEIREQIERVTKEDIVRVARLCLNGAQPTLAALGPVGSLREAQLYERLVA